MSLKFERDTVRETVNQAAANYATNKGGFVGSAAAAVAEAASGNLPGTSGKHPIAEVVGTALTGGRQNAGTKGYLAVCFAPTKPCPRVERSGDCAPIWGKHGETVVKG
jgi:hypothetical protein